MEGYNLFMSLKLSKNQEKILSIIGTGAILVTALVAPNAIGAFNSISKQIKSLTKAKTKYRAKQSIKDLIDKNIIYLAGDRVVLTKRGQDLLRLIQIKEIELTIPEKWDQIWHLVSYDIPEKKKKERDFFRFKITELGFRQIQDSLWVYPFECREEIAIIAQTLGLSPYVAYLNTDHLPLQNKLEQHFKLN
jgi:hypothetical protein